VGGGHSPLHSGDAGDETALSDKSVIFPAGFGLKGCRVGHGDLEEARFAVGWEEGRVCVGGAGRALGDRDGDPLSYH